jgi:hypothetical protein
MDLLTVTDLDGMVTPILQGLMAVVFVLGGLLVGLSFLDLGRRYGAPDDN